MVVCLCVCLFNRVPYNTIGSGLNSQNSNRYFNNDFRYFGKFCILLLCYTQIDFFRIRFSCLYSFFLQNSASIGSCINIWFHSQLFVQRPLCVSVHVCVHAFMYVTLYSYILMYIFKYLLVHTYINTYVCVCVILHTCLFAYIGLFSTYVYLLDICCMDVCLYIYIDIFVYA